MKRFILLASAVLLGLGACKKHDCGNTGEDYFVFGRAFGMCGGPNCAQFYKIQNGSMYADNMDYYTENNVFTFSNNPMPALKYSAAVPAMTAFPDYLRRNPDHTWGCPDCHDQGGLHFALSQNGITHFWHVDTDTALQPQAIRPYINQVNQILDQLAN